MAAGSLTTTPGFLFFPVCWWNQLGNTESATWCMQAEIVFACVQVPIPFFCVYCCSSVYSHKTSYEAVIGIFSFHHHLRNTFTLKSMDTTKYILVQTGRRRWLLMWNDCWWQSSWSVHYRIYKDFHWHQGLHKKVLTDEMSSEEQWCGDTSVVDFRGQTFIDSLRQL